MAGLTQDGVVGRADLESHVPVYAGITDTVAAYTNVIPEAYRPTSPTSPNFPGPHSIWATRTREEDRLMETQPSTPYRPGQSIFHLQTMLRTISFRHSVIPQLIPTGRL